MQADLVQQIKPSSAQECPVLRRIIATGYLFKALLGAPQRLRRLFQPLRRSENEKAAQEQETEMPLEFVYPQVSIVALPPQNNIDWFVTFSETVGLSLFDHMGSEQQTEVKIHLHRSVSDIEAPKCHVTLLKCTL
jgi:hypothetical protein